jgi:hypothetical protein
MATAGLGRVGGYLEPFQGMHMGGEGALEPPIRLEQDHNA